MLDLCPVSTLTTGEDRKQQSVTREDLQRSLTGENLATNLQDAVTGTSIIFSFSTTVSSWDGCTRYTELCHSGYPG